MPGENRKFKIISITHAEDIDGLGAQAILQRFFSDPKRKIPAEIKLHSDSGLFETITDHNYVFINIRTDYDGIIPYWAAIFAENPHLTDVRKIPNLFPDNHLQSNPSPKLSAAPADLNFMQRFVLFLNYLMGKTQKTDEIIKLMQYMHEPATNTSLLADKLFEVFNYSLRPHCENIIKFHEDYKNPALIIITDLGIDKVHESIFRVLQYSSYNIAYLDHHEHFPGAKSFLESYSSLYFVDRELCSTEIAKNIFLPDDQISIKIAEYGMDSDYALNKFPHTDKIMAVIGKYYLDYSVTDEICHSFTQGEFFNDYISQLFNKVEIWERQQHQVIKQTFIFKTINHNKLGTIKLYMGQSELRASRTNRYLDKFICDTMQPREKTLFISFQVNSGKANIRSKFFNVFKIAEVFGGGGHIERAGFTLPLRYLKDISAVGIGNKHGFRLENIDIDHFIQSFCDYLELQ